LLINLLDNALKYSEGAVELDAAVQENLMEISVSDRGPGIAEPVREAMFRPYSRGDRSGQRGSGLGLAVCRAIAQAHGGSLSVENRDGGGSRFCLSLPIEEQP
jgi:two-component system sensor histidine kinase KdpD